MNDGVTFRPGVRGGLFLALCLAIAWLAGSADSARAASDSWNVNAAGNWTTAANWLGSQAPGSATVDNGDVATFSYTLTAPHHAHPRDAKQRGRRLHLTAGANSTSASEIFRHRI